MKKIILVLFIFTCFFMTAQDKKNRILLKTGMVKGNQVITVYVEENHKNLRKIELEAERGQIEVKSMTIRYTDDSRETLNKNFIINANSSTKVIPVIRPVLKIVILCKAIGDEDVNLDYIHVYGIF